MSSVSLGENWSSKNAQQCIKNDELPIPCFTKVHIDTFLSKYQKAYPSKVEEYLFLCKLKISDWKFCVKRFKCTSWHHYGAAAQRTGFWDLWALSDEILKVCRTSKGAYQYQLLQNWISSTKSDYRNRVNDLTNNYQVRLGVIKYLDTSGQVYAPCLIWETWSKTRKQELCYFDYLKLDKYYECDTLTTLTNGDISNLLEFSITNTFRKIDDDVFDKFSNIKKSSFYKLIDYAKRFGWTICTIDEDTRPKLEYKGPPQS